MKGVGFDFDHTLGVDKKLERRALLDVLDDEVLLDDCDPLRCAVLVDEVLQAYRKGTVSLEAALTQLFAVCLEPQYDSQELIQNFYRHTIALAPEHIQPLPGAIELLATLSAAGIPTAILTNGWNPLQQKKADLLGYRGPVLVSGDLGIRKPDGQAFHILATTLNLPPQDILFVGDSPSADIAGALHAGMSAAWFDWEGNAYDSHSPQPTFTIHTLFEVVDLMLASPQSAVSR